MLVLCCLQAFDISRYLPLFLKTTEGILAWFTICSLLAVYVWLVDTEVVSEMLVCSLSASVSFVAVGVFFLLSCCLSMSCPCWPICSLHIFVPLTFPLRIQWLKYCSWFVNLYLLHLALGWRFHLFPQSSVVYCFNGRLLEVSSNFSIFSFIFSINLSFSSSFLCSSAICWSSEDLLGKICLHFALFKLWVTPDSIRI